MDYLNKEGKYRAVYANIETAQTARNDVARGTHAITGALIEAARLHLGENDGFRWMKEARASTGEDGLVNGWLRRWAEEDLEHPAILLLDEVDALVGDTLVALLRQLRSGYSQRPHSFPQSVILCGVRDVRDYRIHTSEGEIITGGSAFNVKAESLRLGSFTFEETVSLWKQHEEATGQCIDPAIWQELWLDTEGQPWLVNALGHECTWKDRASRDRTQPITLERYFAARERLIQSRATHLDQLVDKLREPRVHSLIAPLLEGDDVLMDVPSDDKQYVEDLGLIRVKPSIRISNRIYQEVIPRELIWVVQSSILHETPWYVAKDGKLDMPKLLGAFQQFFREHSDAWIDGFSYKEAGPQLLLQAFLQRVVNGGGRISREYALGRKRTDLLIEWPVDEKAGFHGEVQRVVIECKLVKKGEPLSVLPTALEQTADYAEQVGAEEAYLVIFDRRGVLSWEERCWQRKEAFREREILVWGM
jgi:hypothetical protein